MKSSGKHYAQYVQHPSTSSFQPSNFENKYKAFIKETQRDRNFFLALQTRSVGRGHELERIVVTTAGSEGKGCPFRFGPRLSQLASCGPAGGAEASGAVRGAEDARPSPRHPGLPSHPWLQGNPETRVPAHAPPQRQAICITGRGAGM